MRNVKNGHVKPATWRKRNENRRGRTTDVTLKAVRRQTAADRRAILHPEDDDDE